MQTRLDLKTIHPLLVDQAAQAFEEGDAGRFLFGCGCRDNELALVADNMMHLRQRGIYEQCLLFAFTDAKRNFHRWPTCILQILFNRADTQKLRAAGDTIPDQACFQIYRGIAGRRDRRPRGYAWTLSRDVACWYASRFSLANPCVISAEVSNEDVLAYVNDRDEQEVVCRPRKCQKMKLMLAEIEEGAHRHQQAMQQCHEALKAKLLSKIHEAKPVAAND